MKVLFRVESGGKIGYGHLMRSINLATELQKRKNEVIFLTKTSKEELERRNFNFKIISKNTKSEIINHIKEINPDIIISDLPYDYSKKYSKEISKNFPQSLKITLDETKNFKYFDIFINSLVRVKKFSRKIFQGEKYIVLSEEVKKYHLKNKIIKENPEEILITFGGSDPYHITEKVLKFLEDFKENIIFRVVIGRGFKRKIRCKNENIYFEKNVENLPALIYNSDIGITSYGITLYEFCCIGTPPLVISYNDYTHFLAKEISKKNLCVYLGKKNELKKDYFLSQLKKIISDEKKRTNISLKGKKTIDGKGDERIINLIERCREKF
jgi:spore coat polysaccharide biosynthesis predicted glycosyltransferase SpsG